MCWDAHIERTSAAGTRSAPRGQGLQPLVLNLADVSTLPDRSARPHQSLDIRRNETPTKRDIGLLGNRQLDFRHNLTPNIGRN